MADSDKNIIITPSTGTAAQPTIEFTGFDNNTLTLSVLDDGTLSISGSAGQLFSVSDSLSGTIFSVNDVSGIPSIEVDDDGTIRLGEFGGNILLGTATDNATDKLQVNGSVSATSFTGTVAWSNLTDVPDPTVTLTGAVTGSATMTNLGSISIATTATADPTLTINGDASGSATFTNLGNATLTLTISDDSHNHVISNVDGLQTALDAKLPLAGGTLTGDLQIGNGTAQTNLLIQKADNNVSDHIIFYNGTTRVGEIGVQDTSWLRLNQVTNTNIYTPRYIRADAGLFVNDASTGIDTNGNLVGIGTASFNGVVTSTVAAGTAPFTIASNTKVANLNADYLDNYSSASFFRENLGTINSSSQDFNSFTTTGSYFVNNWSETGDVVANGPTGSFASGCLKVTQFNGATYVLQEYWPHNTDISWSRVRWAGTWTGWRESWGSGNDGAGSGLDADKLDGQEGSYYLNYNNFTNTPTIPTDTNDYVDSIAFNTASGVVTLGRTGSLADLTVDLDGRYLLTTGKAADSDKLDNLNSTDFARYIATPAAGSGNNLADQAWLVNYTDANNVDYVYYNEATNSFNFNADTAYNANTATAVVSAATFKEGGTNLSGKYLGLTAKAADSQLLDGIDSTAFVRSNADDTIGGDINLTAALSYTQTNPVAGIHVIRPQGALYSTNTSALTGYLKVTLPVSWTGTMMGMWIDIYDYAGNTNGESISLYVGGYNYATTTAWINCFAKVISSREDRYYNVRFGHDGTKCAIYIGEETTVWSYPQVSVRDFYAGFGNATTANWQDGWNVGFTTTLGTITKTVVAGLTADYALNADKLDGQQGTYYLNTSTNFGGDVSGTYNAIVVANDSHTHDTRYYTETEADSRFLRRNLSGGTIDVNAANGTQLYIGSTGSWTNRGPAGNNAGSLFSINTHPGNYYSQLWFDTAGGSMYHRTANNALPTGAWQKMWTSGNDGASSGLDADLLDGYHMFDFTRSIAKGLGWEGTYDATSSTIAYNAVDWDITENSVVIRGDAGDSSIGAAYRAIRVIKGETVRFTVTLKGDVANTSGLYLRLYYHNGDMPNGKTHVSNGSANGSQFVQEEDGPTSQSWVENAAVPTSWTTYEYDFTAVADGYVSLVVLNWTGNGTDDIYIRQPDIQKVTEYSRKLFQTSNTAATANQYTKICRVTITSQYKDYSVTGYLHSAAEGGVDNAPERFDFSVKQQSAFGSNPLVYLRQYPTTTSRVQLGYVIVQNTPSSIVDVYAKITESYTVIHGHSATESNRQYADWLNTQTINTTEPAGIVYRASNKLFHDDYHPNADKWTNSITLTLTGDVTGSASFDGSGNFSLATTGGGGTDLTALTDMTQTFLSSDEFVVLDSNAPRRKAASEIISDLDIVTGNITGTLFADVIAANQIYADMIAANQITANLIAANAITANEIKANEVKAAQLEISSTASVANSIFFDGANNRIDIKDASGNLRVRIGQL